MIHELYYRVIYFKVVDEAVGIIKNLLQGIDYEILLTAKRFLLQSFRSDPVLQDDHDMLEEHFKYDFKYDLNIGRLKPQL